MRTSVSIAIVVACAGAASADPVSPSVPAWRQRLAELGRVDELRDVALSIRGALPILDRITERARDAYEAAVVALPDDSADLPFAVCRLGNHHRGVREAQLRRAIAVATNQAHGDVDKLYGSLRGQAFAVMPAWKTLDGKLTRDDGLVMLRSTGPSECDAPDAGKLRRELVELYDNELRYPNDPFTGAPDLGPPTTKRGRPRAATDELDALYRDIASLAPRDPALATVLEIAAHSVCAGGPARVSVCMTPRAATTKALAIRTAKLPPGDHLVAATHLAHAAMQTGGTSVDAERELRDILSTAPPGDLSRVLAALDLMGRLHARGEVTAARALEPAVIDALSHPALASTWEWVTVAEHWAQLAHAEGRDANAVAIVAAAVRGVTPPNPLCNIVACDNRNFRIELLELQVTIDRANAVQLRGEISRLRAQVDDLHDQRVADVRRLIQTTKP